MRKGLEPVRDRWGFDPLVQFLASRGVAVMGGHEEGIVSFGSDIEQAAERILALRD